MVLRTLGCEISVPRNFAHLIYSRCIYLRLSRRAIGSSWAVELELSHTDPWLTYATVKRSQGGGAWFPEGERREKKRERLEGKREIPKMAQKESKTP